MNPHRINYMKDEKWLLRRFYKIVSDHINNYHVSKADQWWDSLSQKEKDKIRGAKK